MSKKWGEIGRWTGWKWLGLLVVALLSLLSLVGPLLTWPRSDESIALLGARHVAAGEWPYRDFYDFITPGTFFWGGLLTRLNGFSVLGLRLWVVLGWLMQCVLLASLGRRHLRPLEMGLFLGFLWLTDCRYPVWQHHFWSGFAALGAIVAMRSAIFRVYAGQSSRGFLCVSGLLTALTFWLTQSLGVFLWLGLAFFGVLHCVLHEREEQGISYHQLSNRGVAKRWLRQWGRFWVLPGLALHGAMALLLVALGMWPPFVQDVGGWLAAGHYGQTTLFGYFPTFHQEFVETIRPLLDGVRMPYLLLFLPRIAIAAHLFLIGLLPVMGILGMGYWLPARFVYRLLKPEDEELLLFWVGATAMVISTMSYCTSMHLVSNGGLAFLLGWIALCHWVRQCPWRRITFPFVVGSVLGVALLGGVVGSGMTLMLGSWLPAFPAVPESLVYTGQGTSAKQLLAVIDRLQAAGRQGETVYVLGDSPELYLPGRYRNATRFILTIPVYTSSGQIREILRDLARHRPLYVVDDQSRFALRHDARYARYSPQQLHLLQIEQYIQAQYVLQETQGRYWVYRRKPGF